MDEVLRKPIWSHFTFFYTNFLILSKGRPLSGTWWYVVWPRWWTPRLLIFALAGRTSSLCSIKQHQIMMRTLWTLHFRPQDTLLVSTRNCTFFIVNYTLTCSLNIFKKFLCLSFLFPHSDNISAAFCGGHWLFPGCSKVFVGVCV